MKLSLTHTHVRVCVRMAAVLTPSAVTRLALSRCLSRALSRAWLLRQANSLRSHTESHTPPPRLIEREGRRSGALRSGRGAMNISVSFGLRPPSWSEKVNERGNRRTFEYVPPRIKGQETGKACASVHAHRSHGQRSKWTNRFRRQRGSSR